ncbi:hypothetical protein LXL04_011943 [Taraxacum kok-saghyz]
MRLISLVVFIVPELFCVVYLISSSRTLICIDTAGDWQFSSFRLPFFRSESSCVLRCRVELQQLHHPILPILTFGLIVFEVPATYRFSTRHFSNFNFTLKSYINATKMDVLLWNMYQVYKISDSNNISRFDEPTSSLVTVDTYFRSKPPINGLPFRLIGVHNYTRIKIRVVFVFAKFVSCKFVSDTNTRHADTDCQEASISYQRSKYKQNQKTKPHKRDKV